MLNKQQIDKFQRYGFLMTEDLVFYELDNALLTKTCDMVAELNPATHHAFFLTADREQTSDEHLLCSEGELHQDKAALLNKVGHALHDLNLMFD